MEDDLNQKKSNNPSLYHPEIKQSPMSTLSQQQPQITLPYKKTTTQITKDDISQLKDKIIEQATRLSNLEQYKSILEERISQLTPTQQFPITNNNLIQPETDQDSEKKKIMAALRKETLLNEQQRNYIELLKETLENNILKSGIGNFIQSSTHYQSYINEKGDLSSLADFMVDFSNCRKDINGLRQEINIKSNQLCDKTQENLSLKKQIEDMTIKANQIKNSFQNDKEKIEKLTQSLNDVTQEKNCLKEEINALKTQNMSLYSAIDNANSINKNHERKLMTQHGQIEDMTTDLNECQNQRLIIKKYEDTIESLNFNLKRLSNEHNDTIDDINQLKEIIDNKIIDINRLKEVIKANEIEYQKERRMIIATSNEHELYKKKAEDSNMELSKEMEHNQLIIVDLNQKIATKENDIARLEEEIHNIQLKYKDLYLKYTSLNELNEKRQSETKNHIAELQDTIDGLSKDNIAIKEKVIQMTNESTIQEANYNIIKKDNEEAQIALKNLGDQFDKLFIEHQQLTGEKNKYFNEKASYCKELKFWKEKYDQDLNSKDAHIQDLTNVINEEKNKALIMQKDIDKFCYNNETITQALKDKNDKELIHLNQMKKLKEMNTALTTKINKAKEDIELEKINSDSLNKKAEEFERQFNDISQSNKQLLEDRKKILSELNTSKQTIKDKSAFINEILTLISAKKNKLRSLNCNSDNFNLFLSNNSNDITEYINQTTTEIDKLNSIILKLESNLNEINLQFTILQKDKSSSDYQKEEIEKVYNDLLHQNSNLKAVQYDLMQELNQCKEDMSNLTKMNHNLDTDITTKNTMLSNASFQLDSIEDRLMLLDNEKCYIETILFRMCKMFPNVNLLQIIQTIIGLNYEIGEIQNKKTITSKANESFVYLQQSIEEKMKEKEYQNEVLLKELKRAEDYLKLIKENSLETQYLNKQLTKQLMETQLHRSMMNANNSGINGSTINANLNGSGSNSGSFNLSARQSYQDSFK